MTACEELDLWLNEGRPRGGDGCEAHARTCLRCAAALRAARELDSALAVFPEAGAPAGFTDRVMVAVSAPTVTMARDQVGRALPWVLFGFFATLLAGGAWLALPEHLEFGADAFDPAAVAGAPLPLAAQVILSLAFAVAATAGGWWLARLALLWTLRAATWRTPHPVR